MITLYHFSAMAHSFSQLKYSPVSNAHKIWSTSQVMDLTHLGQSIKRTVFIQKRASYTSRPYSMDVNLNMNEIFQCSEDPLLLVSNRFLDPHPVSVFGQHDCLFLSIPFFFKECSFQLNSNGVTPIRKDADRSFACSRDSTVLILNLTLCSNGSN